MEDHYAHGLGQLTIDLRQLDVARDVTVHASVGIGDLVVLAPPGVQLDVTATAGVGEVRALDRTSSGFAPRVAQTFPGDRPGLTLELSVGIGQVTVRR